MTDRKIILLLIPNLNFGGAQRVFYNLSLLLSERYHVIECVFNLDKGHTYKTSNDLVSLNVKGGNTFFEKVFRFFQRVNRLRQLKKNLNPAVCISHLEGADLVNVLSRKKESVITWVHGSKVHDQNIEGLLGFIRHHFLIPLTYRLADKVITVSHAIQQELINTYRVPSKRSMVIYNYFRRDEIASSAKVEIPTKHRNIFSQKPVIVFSGRLARQKNVHTFINWFNCFKQQYDSKLLFLGDGELRSQLLELCASLELKTYSIWNGEGLLTGDEQVYFLGYCKNPYQYIARSSIFVLPSLWEGFPLSLGEAMFCGIPVVSADCPTGPAEMLRNEEGDDSEAANYGVLLPLLTEDVFAKWTSRIGSLLTDHNEWNRYARLSLHRAGDFEQSRIEGQILHLIGELVQ